MSNRTTDRVRRHEAVQKAIRLVVNDGYPPLTARQVIAREYNTTAWWVKQWVKLEGYRPLEDLTTDVDYLDHIEEELLVRDERSLRELMMEFTAKGDHATAKTIAVSWAIAFDKANKLKARR